MIAHFVEEGVPMQSGRVSDNRSPTDCAGGRSRALRIGIRWAGAAHRYFFLIRFLIRWAPRGPM